MASLTSDDLKVWLGFPFQDGNWKNKFLIGSLVVLAGFVIPVAPFLILYGYVMKIMRRIIVDQGEPYLPEWDEWGQLLTDGFKLVGAMLVYVLPVVLLFILAYGCFVGSIISAAISADAAERGDQTAQVLVNVLPVLGMLGLMITFGIGMLLSLGLGVIMPAMVGHVVATNRVGAAFRWREWWPIFRANLSGFLLAYVVVLALSFGLSTIFSILYATIIFCCLLPFLMGPITLYMTIINHTIYALAYRDGVRKLHGR